MPVPKLSYSERSLVDSFADCWTPAEDLDLDSPNLADDGLIADAVRIRDYFDSAVSQVLPATTASHHAQRQRNSTPGES